MGLIGSVRGWLSRAFSDVKPGPARTMLEGVRTYGEPPPRGTKEFLELYETSPWIRAATGKVGFMVGQTEWEIHRSDRPGVVVPDAQLEIPYKVLRYGNVSPAAAMLTGPQLWQLVQQSVDLVGDAFLLREMNAMGRTVGLWPIPAHWIMELPIPGRPTYRVSWKSWSGYIPEDEIIRITDPRLVDPYSRGTGLVRSLGDEIETDEYAAKHAKTLFYNRAMPDVVIMDPNAEETELDRYEMHWRNRLQGYLRSHLPFFANRKLEFWQPTTPNLENLTLVPLRKFERDVILQTYGIPPEQMGIVENSNRATSEASDFIMEKRVIEPRRIALAAQLQQKLLWSYNGDMRLQLRFKSTIPADKEYQRAVMVGAPWAFGESEWRQQAGYPAAAPSGDVRMVPMNSYATTDLTDAEQRPQAAGPKPPTQQPAEEMA